MSYKVDYRDRLRHLANACFIVTYLSFEHGHVFWGALFTLLGESLLIPSAIKQKSWSTYIIAGIFIVLSLGTLSRLVIG